MAKLLRRTHSLLCLHAKYATSTKSHYDTLQVQSDATHTEIKSAYYKLTLQYHPDKNTTQDAKTKFQEISSAYEILGNYSTRQAYDRRLGITSTATGSAQTMTGYKREPFRTSHSKDETIYNFDEWNRKHYTDGFEATLQYKRSRERARALENSKYVYSPENDPQIYIIMATVVIVVACVMWGITLQANETNDIPRKPS